MNEPLDRNTSTQARVKLRTRKTLFALLMLAVVFSLVGWWSSQHRVNIERALPVTSTVDSRHAKHEVLRVSESVDDIAWSPDSSTLMILTRNKASKRPDHNIVLWDLAVGRDARTLHQSTNTLNSVSWSPDGATLACGAWRRDNNSEIDVLLWHRESGNKIAGLSSGPRDALGFHYSSDPVKIAISLDGRWVAAGTKLVDQEHNIGTHIGGEVCVWNLLNKKLQWSDRTTHTDIVQALAFSADGRTLASGGRDKLIRLWDAETGLLKKTLLGAGWDGVSSIAFSPTASLLASGGVGTEEGHMVRIWNADTGELRHGLNAEFQLGGTVRVEFSPDGKWLYAVGQSSESDSPKWRVARWEAVNGKGRAVIAQQSGSARTLSASPDGKRIAVGTFEGEIFLIAAE